MRSARESLQCNWREYAIDGALLGIFMISACGFTALIKYPASPANRIVGGDFLQGTVIGLAMGLTAISLIYSPWGRRSGAHMNPAVTLTFFRLGRVSKWDGLFYVLMQFAGGAIGVMLSALFIPVVSHPAINYAVTQPGTQGVAIAFIAEVTITLLMMLVVLRTSSSERRQPYTGLFAGLLVWLYITFEAPLSGMSMNPARSLASALAAREWNALWIYFAAPPLGMLLAAQIHLLWGAHSSCAKYHHDIRFRCIFCEYKEQRGTTETDPSGPRTTVIKIMSGGGN